MNEPRGVRYGAPFCTPKPRPDPERPPSTEPVVSDELLDQAQKELEVQMKINAILRTVAPERRLRVLRAASIMATGKDLSELARQPSFWSGSDKDG